jgi:hypothetical protein
MLFLTVLSRKKRKKKPDLWEENYPAGPGKKATAI